MNFIETKIGNEIASLASSVLRMVLKKGQKNSYAENCPKTAIPDIINAHPDWEYVSYIPLDDEWVTLIFKR